MFLTTKQIIFNFFFLLGWLLLFLLGESYLSYILMGGVSLFLLLFSGELEWKRLNKWLIVLWLLFLFSLGLSTFFSINLPLSLYLVTRYVYVFITFWFFFSIKKSFISNQQIIKLLLLTGLLTMGISVSFQFFPQLLDLLPGINLLHATYGHNHLSGLMLLVIPLGWWLAGKHVEKGGLSWWWLLPVGFTLGLLVSFGRVAVLIGLIQFIFIYLQVRGSKLANNSKFKLVGKVLAGLFSVVLLGNVFFSIVSLINPEFACPVPGLEKQLCKSVETESRPRYWSWAVEIVKDHPWVGSGPGTFGIAARKYRLVSYGSASHAHNAFLQAGAELGLVGGTIFMVLMVSLLLLAWRSLKKEKGWGWRKATFLGIISIYIDVLFDFDWDFIGIFSITLILLALLIKDKKYPPVSKLIINILKTWYFILVLAVIFIAGLYLKTDGLIRAGNTQQAFQFFPYFHWHLRTYEVSNKIDRNRLFNIYAAYPSIYPVWLSSTDNEQQRQQIKEDWFQVDPLSAATRDIVSYYLEQQNWTMAGYWLEQVVELYSYPVAHGYELDHQQIQIRINDQRLTLAAGFLESGNFQNAFEWLEQITAAELVWSQKERVATLLVEVGNELSVSDMEKTVKAYSLAKKHLHWILSTNNLWFEQRRSEELSADELSKYLQLTTNWRDEGMGWKDEKQRFLQQEILKIFISTDDWENLIVVLPIIDWSQHDDEIKMELVKDITQLADSLVEKSDYQLASELLLAAQYLLSSHYLLVIQPANLAVVEGDLEKAKELYQRCLENYKIETGSNHDDCHYGLQLVENNFANRNHYFQVSRIIRGEVGW